MAVQKNLKEYPDSSLSLQSFVWSILAMGVGMLAAVIVLPVWAPHLAVSLAGSDPKAYWYFSRGSALWRSASSGFQWS